MIKFNVFPNGKKRCVTFSYDDGCDNDARLVTLLNKYGMKGTFHLNGINYRGYSDEQLQEVGKIYEGHEVSCHTYSHCYPTLMPVQSVIREIMDDRFVLEKIAGYPMKGMSYPAGSCSDAVAQTLRDCGMYYGRTTKSTRDFLMPRNFMLWHPTCHHNEAPELAEKYMERIDSFVTWPLFYIWGHSSEFRTEEQWQTFEGVLKRLAETDKIWYATNAQIVRYVQAQHSLEISVDETVAYNPSAISVWVEKDGKNIIEIPAGQTVKL